jgi:hypothetical protein
MLAAVVELVTNETAIRSVLVDQAAAELLPAMQIHLLLQLIQAVAAAAVT